jgi:hypothetical protein
MYIYIHIYTRTNSKAYYLAPTDRACAVVAPHTHTHTHTHTLVPVSEDGSKGLVKCIMVGVAVYALHEAVVRLHHALDVLWLCVCMYVCMDGWMDACIYVSYVSCFMCMYVSVNKLVKDTQLFIV